MEKEALSGIRVLEYAQLVAGPYCAKMFADLGAEVIKIEQPGVGDQARHLEPFLNEIPHPERSGLFLYLNTNKKGITLNLETVTGVNLFKELIEISDIFIETPPPRQLEELGLGYNVLKEVNPKLVMVSISPFGQTGPYKDYRTSDLVSFHMSGFGYLNPRGATDANRPPLKAGGRLADFFAALNAAGAALCALHARRLTGLGQHVDISRQECIIPMLRRPLTAYFYRDRQISSRLTRSWRIAPNDLMPCKDGYVFVSAVEEGQWQRFVELMGNPDWAKDPRFQNRISRTENWEVLEPLITAWLMKHTKEEISRTAQANRVPISPVNTAGDLFKSRHLNTRGFFVEIDHPEAGKLKYPGAPYRLSQTPWRLKRRAPLLGEYNEEVYCDLLGHSKRELVKMREAGVI
jgi:crotonobetainyl-CoA:carnitine CoA-transferase CaiB-like acyl-CoA transferase